MTSRHGTFFSLLSALSWILTACSAAAPEPTSRPMNTAHDINQVAQTLPEISIEILGPITSLKGYDWPRGYDWVTEKQDQPRRQFLVDQPHNVAARLPSGRTIRYVSKATFFNHEHGSVTRASLMPQLGGPMRYQDAVSLVESVLSQWDAEPDARTKKLLEEWKAEGNLAPYELAKRSGSAEFHEEKRVGIYFEIRSTSDNTGWYAAIDVAATWEEVRQIKGLPSIDKPSSQPSTAPANSISQP